MKGMIFRTTRVTVSAALAVMAALLMASCSEDPTAAPAATLGETISELEVLVALYEAAGGANWIQNSNWLSDAPLGEWDGVTTDVSGRVINLPLYENKLSGEIPPELGGLSNLEMLYLGDNDLSGCIPEGLQKVQGNDFAHAGLKSCTPGETILDRDAIVALYEATNGADWSEQSNWLSDAPIWQWHGVITDDSGRVIELGLGGNELTGEIPPELGELSNLEMLSLRGNDLSGCIPESLREVQRNDFAEVGLPFCE